MERFFILDKFNTWYDFGLILTAKNITPPEPKTNYVDIDGMSGTIDLTESLTGETTYNDRTISASFWTDKGNRKDRDILLRKIITALHGKKIKIIEPDDTEHYYNGRLILKSYENNLAYLEFSIEITAEPWRYRNFETERYIEVNSTEVSKVVIHNSGVKSLSPTIEVDGDIDILHEGVKTSLSTGNYKISSVKLKPGTTVIGVSGNGSATIRYRECDL